MSADRRAAAVSPASAAALARRTRSNTAARAPGVSRSSSIALAENRANRAVDGPRRSSAPSARPAGVDHRTSGQRVGQVEPPGHLVQPGQAGLGVGHRPRGHLDR